MQNTECQCEPAALPAMEIIHPVDMRDCGVCVWGGHTTRCIAFLCLSHPVTEFISAVISGHDTSCVTPHVT